MKANIKLDKNKENKEIIAVVDDGTREIPFYNTFHQLICKIHIRPADFDLANRYLRFVKEDFPKIIEPLGKMDIERDGTATHEDDVAELNTATDRLKLAINAMLDSDDADGIFQTRNPFSSVGGKFFCANVLDAIGKIVEQVMSEEEHLTNKRLSKFLPPVEDGGDVNAGDTAENA